MTGFAFLIVMTIFGLHSAFLIASGQHLKGRVLGSADDGIEHLKNAQVALQAQDSTASGQQLQLALSSFKTSKDDLNNSNILLRGLMSILPQKNDADKLLEASSLIPRNTSFCNKRASFK